MPRNSVLGRSALVLMAAHPGLVSAQDSTALEELIVTASRTELPAPAVGSSVSVITRETLEARHYQLVSDALQEVPGVGVSRGGGFGAVTQVRIRGAEGNHTLVLIDGVEANNPVSNSEFDFANLLVADIERIEVLRGPQSALYGSDAIGGVINVITRKATPGTRASLRAETGSLGARELAVTASRGSERAGVAVSLDHLATDGFNIARSGGERDGYANDTLTLAADREVGANVAVKARLRYINASQQFDSQDFAFPPSPTQGLVIDDAVNGALEQWFLRLESDFSAPDAPWQHRVALNHTDTDNRFFDTGIFESGNRAEKTQLELQSTREFGEAAALTLALERESVDYANRGATPQASETQAHSDAQSSAIVEYRARWHALELSLGARYDANERFDDATTYRATLARRLGASHRLHASFGTGVANPGFFELYGFFPDSFVGNPTLKPERSQGFDIGLEQRLAGERIVLDATYFRADLEDEIETVFDGTTFLATVVNLDGRSARQGVEFSLGAAVTPAWRLDASLTLSESSAPDGRAELRRPRRLGSLASTYTFAEGRGRFNTTLDYTGRQEDSEFRIATPADRVTLDVFTLLRAAVDYELVSGWRVYGRADNLLDADYEEWFSYRSPGRTLALGFERTFAP